MRKATTWKQVLSVVCAASMLTGCGAGAGGSSKKGSDTLVVGYAPFNQKFSPFFSETSYDKDVYALTSVKLIDNDRSGEIIYKGIKGEKKKYNGKTYTYKGLSDVKTTENDDGTVEYDFKLRDGVKFSDGKPLTADDLIFSFYVLADPTYDGSSSFSSLPITGMDKYRSGVESLGKALAAAGKDNTKFDAWDEATQKAFWEKDLPEAGKKFAQSILDYVVANGYNKKGDSVKDCAANWGYELSDDATAEDFWNAILEKYEGDPYAAADKEKADKTLPDILDEKYAKGVTVGDTVDHIEGIKKVSKNEVKVTLDKVDATAIYQFGVDVTPLHYYGETSKYDYKNNKFGFTKGDLSHVKSVTTKPLGAGPYVFKGYKNGKVNFTANENYYKGAPKIKNVTFQESQEADLLNGVTTGTIDIATPSLNADAAKNIKKQNSNGKLSGDKIKTALHDFLGYGYIGMNANLVKVGNDSGSEESKAYRKGFATIVSAYRDVAIDSYYGDAATVINYPISNTSWAAPQKTDSDYKPAFSVDVNGEEIYKDGMSADEKYEAAKKAALGFFEKAGCKVSDGKVTAGPDGKPIVFTAVIPGDGKGDHPSFMILTEAQKAFKSIGINFEINDLSDSSQLWDGLKAGQIQMWCAAWGATLDPDMTQIYYADVANGGKNAGGSNYQYEIADAELDKIIFDAKTHLDQQYRKAKYKAALDIIVDWAVEIPVYQRSECTIFSVDRVKTDTITPDITTFYPWAKEIEKLELK
ncbi:MAG: ABC transporter substrate-binding protein [Lachnospiraceae bacterium]|nr:ABC transporter substrate-binding protein [Lachnospiraceae bacterium]